MTKSQINSRIFSIVKEAEKKITSLIKNEKVDVYEEEVDWINPYAIGCREKLDAAGIILNIYDHDSDKEKYKFFIVTKEDDKNREKTIAKRKIDNLKSKIEYYRTEIQKCGGYLAECEKKLREISA